MSQRDLQGLNNGSTAEASCDADGFGVNPHLIRMESDKSRMRLFAREAVSTTTSATSAINNSPIVPTNEERTRQESLQVPGIPPVNNIIPSTTALGQNSIHEGVTSDSARTSSVANPQMYTNMISLGGVRKSSISSIPRNLSKQPTPLQIQIENSNRSKSPSLINPITATRDSSRSNVVDSLLPTSPTIPTSNVLAPSPQPSFIGSMKQESAMSSIRSSIKSATRRRRSTAPRRSSVGISPRPSSINPRMRASSLHVSSVNAPQQSVSTSVTGAGGSDLKKIQSNEELKDFNNDREIQPLTYEEKSAIRQRASSVASSFYHRFSDGMLSPLSIRKAKIKFWTRPVHIPTIVNCIKTVRFTIRLLQLCFALATFTSLIRILFRANYSSAILASAGLNLLQFTAISSCFISGGCMFVYCFPVYLGTPPHRHERTSRVEFTLDIAWFLLWLASSSSVLNYGIYCTTTALSPFKGTCIEFTLFTSLAFITCASYAAMVIYGLNDLRTNHWGCDVLEDRPVGSRGTWKIIDYEDDDIFL